MAASDTQTNLRTAALALVAAEGCTAFLIVLATTNDAVASAASFASLGAAGFVATLVALGRSRAALWSPRGEPAPPVSSLAIVGLSSVVMTAVLFVGIWLLFHEVGDRQQIGVDLGDVVVSAGAGLMTVFPIAILWGTRPRARPPDRERVTP